MRGRVFAFVCILIVVSGCNSDARLDGGWSDRNAVVATVGGEPIYARDFVLNYELGFAQLYGSDNTRLVYLNRMIDEKLLALEGRRRGLMNHEGVKQSIQDLKDELLVERVFQRYVNDSVRITTQDIATAMQENQTSFRLRYVPARSLREANLLREESLRRGLPATIREFVSSQEGRNLSPFDFESPHIRKTDLHPDLMAAIVDLPVDEISKPVSYGGQFLLLQVIDIRREPVAPDSDARASFEHVVFNRKAKVRARDFIDSMMKPLDVRLKPASYKTLREEIWQLYRRQPPQGNLLNALIAGAASEKRDLNSMLDDVLITTSDGEWTVREFLAAFPVRRYPLRNEPREAFDNDLYDAIGLTLRDHYFVQRAYEEGLDQDQALRHELDLWTDKWVYRGMLEELSADMNAVKEMVLKLRDRYFVEVNHAVLDTLTLSPPNHSGLTVLKGHTLRPAYPVADPVW